MFELKYKITDGDIKAVNFKTALSYFITYLAVALVGIAIGVTAIVLRSTTVLLVMGILLTIMGAFLLVCSVLLIISPKNFAASALITSDEIERIVRVDDDGITVTSDAQKSDIKFSFYELTKVKLKNGLIVAHIGRDQILLIKDAVTSGGTLAELYELLRSQIANTRGNVPARRQAETAAESAPEAESPSDEPAKTYDGEKPDGE